MPSLAFVDVVDVVVTAVCVTALAVAAVAADVFELPLAEPHAASNREKDAAKSGLAEFINVFPRTRMTLLLTM
jgi:hypothetical protein